MTDLEPVKLQQKDDEVLEIGPIPAKIDANGAIVLLFDATSYTPKLEIKPKKGEPATTTITGSLTGNITTGFFARYEISAAATAVAGVFWMQAYIVAPAGLGSKRFTIKRCPLWIEPV